jgi:hypothetical protein
MAVETSDDLTTVRLLGDSVHMIACQMQWGTAHIIKRLPCVVEEEEEAPLDYDWYWFRPKKQIFTSSFGRTSVGADIVADYGLMNTPTPDMILRDTYVYFEMEDGSVLRPLAEADPLRGVNYGAELLLCAMTEETMLQFRRRYHFGSVGEVFIRTDRHSSLSSLQNARREAWYEENRSEEFE